MLSEKLEEFLLNYALQINKDQVLISEINGIGEIYTATEDLRNYLFDYIQDGVAEYSVFTLDLHYSIDPKIYFYNNRYSIELNSIEDCYDRRYKHLEFGKEEIRKYFLRKYDKNNLLEDYSIALYDENLNPQYKNAVVTYELYTIGSVISKDRKIKIDRYENDLNKGELNFIKKELKKVEYNKSKYEEIEKELFFWYYSNSTNYTSLLFNLIGKADSTNLNKLRSVYPLHVEIFQRFRYEEGYFEKIENIFKQEK